MDTENKTPISDFSLSFTSKDNLSEFQWILDSLPYSITIQNEHREIIYHNEKAQSLFGYMKGDICSHRWCSPSKETCAMCPGSITLKDGNPHKVFRRTKNPEGEEIFLEIETIPILEPTNDRSSNKTPSGYIELIRGVDFNEYKNTKVESEVVNINDFKLAFFNYGQRGGQIIYNERFNLLELDSEEEYLVKLVIFIFIGIFQNNHNRQGLFGPLPLLDKEKFELFAFAFQTVNDKIKDPRNISQTDLCLMFMIFERNNKYIISHREMLNEYLTENISTNLSNINDIDEKFVQKLKKDLHRKLNLIK